MGKPGTVTDFYLTNPIARASQLMAELSANAGAQRARGSSGVGEDYGCHGLMGVAACANAPEIAPA